MSNESILLLTKSDVMTDAIRHELDPTRFRLLSYVPNLAKPEAFFTLLQTRTPSLVFIDSIMDDNDGRLLDSLSQLSLVRLRQTITSADGLPSSLTILRAVEEFRRAAASEGMLVFYFVDGPSPALTQEILRMGADWVWTHRLTIEQTLEQVIDKLRSVSPKHIESKRARPSILIVEDDSFTRSRIEAEIDDIFDVIVVGEDKAGDSFMIEPEEAIAAFLPERHRAVVIDLVLRQEAESRARERYLNESSSIEGFIASLNDEDKSMAFSILQGLEVIRGIRKASPNVPIIAFSNYLIEPTVIDLIRTYFGKELFDSIIHLPKAEENFAQLRELLTEIIPDL
jgi:CheY-like chemotaxis protein